MQRYFTNKLKDNVFILNNDDMYHIKTVMRMKTNDKVEVVYNNELYICNLDKDDNIVIQEKLNQIKNKKVYTTLCVPVLQEQKMSFILQKATELGVDEIIPIITKRSVVKINGKEEQKLIRWRKICKEASEQSKRLDIPIVSSIKSINELNLDGIKIICSTKEKSNSIKKVLQKMIKCDKMVMVIGPEGGLSEEEENILIKQDFIPVTLGDNIMRVETVPIYLLSVLNYELME